MRGAGFMFCLILFNPTFRLEKTQHSQSVSLLNSCRDENTGIGSCKSMQTWLLLVAKSSHDQYLYKLTKRAYIFYHQVCFTKVSKVLIYEWSIILQWYCFWGFFFLQRRIQCAPQQQETATRGCHWLDRPCLLASPHHFSSQMACRL